MKQGLSYTWLMCGVVALHGCGGRIASQADGGAQPTPQVASLPLRAVSAGADHMCGLTAGGTAYCWGSNAYGQLGVGLTGSTQVTEPVRVAGHLAFRRISAGAEYSCGVTLVGEVFCWGLDADAQLGATSRELCQGLPCSTRPVRVASTLRFDDVSAGFFHTCALSDGYAHCWGRNDRGQLGTTSRTSCAGIPCNPTPAPVDGNLRFRAISARGEHTCGLNGTRVYCWGDNRDGQLGIGLSVAAVAAPRRVRSPVAFVDVRAGGLHTCALSADGMVYCWGSNGAGDLGAGAGEGSSIPVAVTPSRAFIAVTTGGSYTCALAADHTVSCWGSGSENALGVPARETCDGQPCSRTPLQIPALRDVLQVSAGGTGTCAISRDGTRCWGGPEGLAIASTPLR